MPCVLPHASPSRIDVLMYHSISDESGPTSISPELFRAQILALKRNDYSVVSLTRLSGWSRGAEQLPERSVVLSFDDGFADFAHTAFPVLQEQGYTATIFLPTGRIGGFEAWEGMNRTPRRLLDWSEVEGLAKAGIEFGGHTVSHVDLTRLAPAELEREIRQSQEDIAARLHMPTRTFAPPYGRINGNVLREISKWAEVSVSTRLDRAAPGTDIANLPRLEMFYFRKPVIWNAYLKRRADLYLKARQIARGTRALLQPFSRRSSLHGA